MPTKKTNDTNKLIQISYHFSLTKIQKLQNFKKKKKNFFLYRPVFFLVRNMGVIRTGLLAGTVYFGRTGRYGTELTPLVRGS